MSVEASCNTPTLPPRTPTDQLTGVPLLIYPYSEPDELFRLRRQQLQLRAEGKDYADTNHIFHPHSARELTSGDGKAIRDCRGQLVLRSDHDSYHRIYSGPPLPKTSDARFKMLVFCLAGYVPRQALDVRSGTSSKTLSNDQIYRMKLSGEVRVVQHETIQKFMTKYVLDNFEMGHIENRLIDEFLTATTDTSYDAHRKQYLTHQLLSLVIDPVTLPLHEAYGQLCRKHLWDRDINMSPRRVVHDEIAGRSWRGRKRTIGKVGQLLTEKLRVYRDIAPAA